MAGIVAGVSAGHKQLLELEKIKKGKETIDGWIPDEQKRDCWTLLRVSPGLVSSSISS
jgi:hypothetical protein